MTIQQIANRLLQLCGEGKFKTAKQELFADNAVSIEPDNSDFFAKETKGLKNILSKDVQFLSRIKEVLGYNLSQPLIVGNVIGFALNMEMILKDGEKVNEAELCVYKVKDGKIILEQFFY